MSVLEKKVASACIAHKWLHDDGSPLHCPEKIKLLEENLEELRTVAQDVLEDGIVMGCSEQQLREALQSLITALENPYRRVK